MKKPVKNILLSLITVLLCFVGGEIFWRYIVFSKNPLFASLRKPAFFADYFSDDDYWKLQYLVSDKYKPSQNPHPLLGWVGDFSRESYLHNDYNAVGAKRPVLLYGDSFAQCIDSVLCFQEILNNDTLFSKQNYLLNYGVGGYGLDQIYLLLKNSYYRYNNPLVIVSFLTEDLDRSILSVRTGQKPYFTLENNQLNLRGIPIQENSRLYFENNPPEIKSYFFNRITHAIPREVCPDLWDNQTVINRKKAINQRIINEIIKELKGHNIDFFFLVFHGMWKGITTLDFKDDWRDPFIKKVFEENNIPYIWSKDIYKRDNINRKNSLLKYFIPGDGHPTSYNNKLIAEEIKKRVIHLTK
jgi:hypothetical protein